MGFIRKSLFVSTLGAVAPNSKKQRVARQTLAAVQGKSEAEVSRTGTRRGAVGYTRYGVAGPGQDAENRAAAEEYQRLHDLARKHGPQSYADVREAAYDKYEREHGQRR